MTLLIPPPERETFEKELHKLISRNVDLSATAALLQKDQSAVSKTFNPFDPTRLNPFYEGTAYRWAFDNLTPGLADEIRSIEDRERSIWLPMHPVAACDADLTANVGIQFSEFIAAKIKGKSYDEQIKECVDIEVAAGKLKADLIRQRNEKVFGIPAPVSFEVREIGRKAVSRRNGHKA